MDKKFYLKKFGLIFAIFFIVSSILFVLGLYSANSALIKDFSYTAPEISNNIFWSSVFGGLIGAFVFSLIFAILITLMIYAQKENNIKIKVGVMFFAIILGTLLVLALFGLI